MNKIWKLQRPIVTNGNSNEVLAYTEGKKQTAIIPMDTALMQELFGDEFKIYVKAKVKRGNLVVDNKVPEQDW